jgi:hypothetical protein
MIKKYLKKSSLAVANYRPVVPVPTHDPRFLYLEIGNIYQRKFTMMGLRSSHWWLPNANRMGPEPLCEEFMQVCVQVVPVARQANFASVCVVLFELLGIFLQWNSVLLLQCKNLATTGLMRPIWWHGYVIFFIDISWKYLRVCMVCHLSVRNMVPTLTSR